MLRRAALVGAIVSAALAPPATAQEPPPLLVQATAAGHFGGFEQTAMRFECAAVDLTGAPAALTRCSFGPLNATLPKGGPAIATGAGTVRAGWPYDLCVSAIAHHGPEPITVAKCAPYDSLTGKVLIGY